MHILWVTPQFVAESLYAMWGEIAVCTWVAWPWLGHVDLRSAYGILLTWACGGRDGPMEVTGQPSWPPT